jgi:hypothetical protein
VADRSGAGNNASTTLSARDFDELLWKSDCRASQRGRILVPDPTDDLRALPFMDTQSDDGEDDDP